MKKQGEATEKSKGNDSFRIIIENNRKWAAECVEKEPDFFKKLTAVQTPKYLWVGCADSRVPANQIMGLKPGEVFVHRNIANLVPPSDINSVSVVQYAVEHLKVENIFVTGHYGCGGVKAAFTQDDYGVLQSWLSHLRQLRCKFRGSLVGSEEQKIDTLVQMNVRQQVLNIAKLPVVQKAWVEGRKLFIHGMVYDIGDGILKDLKITLSKITDVQEEFRIVTK